MPNPPLAVPLTRAQVTAANELYDRYLEGWQRYDRILRALHQHFPSNTDIECVLPKAVTLNQLYATNILAIGRVADDIVKVLGQEHGSPDAGLVEAITQRSKAGPTARNCRSFASKYCHFFIAADRFPIYDDHAGRALTYHLGPRGRSHYRRGPCTYLTYFEDIERIRDAVGADCTYTQLDRYLWLRGQWQAKQTGNDTRINGEVSKLLAITDPAAVRLQHEAFGEPT